MGFFSSVVGGALGAITGVLTGGGVGSILGALSGAATGVEELGKVITGEYHRDQRSVQEKIDQYNEAVSNYEAFALDETGKTLFNDEVINLAVSNKLTRMVTSVELLAKATDQAVKDFNSEYKGVASLARSDLGGIILFLPMTIGGLVTDLKSVLEDGDWEAGKRLLSTLLSTIGSVLAILAGVFLMAVPGGQVAGIALIVAGIAGLTNLIITLDSQYNQGLLMGTIFMSLDVLLNQVLGFDQWLSPDFGKLGDAQYYQELTGYVQTTLAITATIAALVGFVAMPPGAMDSVGALMGDVLPATGDLSGLMLAINAAMTTGNIVEAREYSEELKKKLEAERAEITHRANTLKARKIQKAYKEVEDMLTDSSEIVHQYVASSFASPTATFDPEMTIHANFGYRYTGDSFMTFGFEDVFKTNVQAGDREYEKQILFKTY